MKRKTSRKGLGEIVLRLVLRNADKHRRNPEIWSCNHEIEEIMDIHNAVNQFLVSTIGLFCLALVASFTSYRWFYLLSLVLAYTSLFMTLKVYRYVDTLAIYPETNDLERLVDETLLQESEIYNVRKLNYVEK